MTGIAALMLNVGLGSDAFAQSDYRYRDGFYQQRYQSRGYWRAEQAVAQAYRDILHREPDRRGLREYTDAIMRRGWSVADVRRSIRRSDEYRYQYRYGRGYDWQRPRYR
jgi:hypothetical protein